jgi:carboxypeptidase T
MSLKRLLRSRFVESAGRALGVCASATVLAAALVHGQQAVAAPSAAELDQLTEQEKRTVNLYRVYFPSVELGRKAAISFHEHLLESNYAAGYLVMELGADEQDKLRAFGFRFEQASDFIQKRDKFLTDMQNLRRARAAAAPASGTASASTNITTSGSTGARTASASTFAAAAAVEPSIVGIPGYSCYETVEETFAVADYLVAAYPGLASLIDIGDSWQKTQGSGGYDLRVLKLTNGAVSGDKPKLFINAAIHAREYTTAPLVLSFARWLTGGWGVDADATWLLDHHEVHLLLQTNPDGRKRAEAGLSWRKNVNNNHCANTNTRGVDLNRNFSFTWNSTAGQGSSGNACDLTYRGPSAGSEPEVQAIQSYLRGLWPDRRGPLATDAAPADTSGIHLDIHSYSQLVLWPWGTTSTPAPNGPALQTLGRRLAWFNGYTPQQSIGLYPTDGTSDSISYGELGVASYTIELGTSFFQSCADYNNTIKPNNLPALIYAAKVARAPYITPGGPDITGLTLGSNASTVGVQVGAAVPLTASATDTRFNNSNGTEATQAIAGAEYTIDTPPWAAGATPVALGAADGSFNATTEGLSGSIATAGLSVGRHTVFVRARDVSGTWGPVSAVFINVLSGPPPLTAAFSSSCSFLACTFNASASGGNITSYQWSFGDSSTGTGVTASRTFSAAGTYNVSLTVGDGSTSTSITQAVTVQAAPAVTQVAEIENNNTRGRAQLVSPNPALVNGTMSSSSDTDYYRISVGAGKTLTVALTPNATSNYNLILYRSNGTEISRSTLGTGAVDRLAVSNTGSSAATVYARVVYASGGTGSTNGRYTLRLEQ